MATATNDKSNSLTQKVSKVLGFQFHLIQGKYCKRIGEILYLLAFFTFSFGSWFVLMGYQSFLGVDYGLFKKTMYGITLLLLGSKLFLQKYRIRELAVIGVVGVILLASSKLSGSRTLVWIFLFIISSQGVSLVPVAFTLLIVLILIGCAAYGGYATGNIADYILNIVGDRSMRHSLGFGHPNTLAVFLLTVFLAFMTIKRWSARWFDVAVGFFLLLFEYIITGSRYVALCFLLVVLVTTYLAASQKTGRIAARVNSFAPIIAKITSICSAALSLYSFFFFDSAKNIWVKIDRLASGRLHLMHGYYKQFGLSLLGNTHKGSAVEFFSAHGDALTFVVDNLFARLLLTYGIVCGGAVILFLFFSEWKLSKANNFVFYCFSLFLIIGVVEAVGTHLEIDFFIIAMGAVLYSEDLGHLAETDSVLNHLVAYRILTGTVPVFSETHGRHADQHPQSEEPEPLSTRAYKERQPYHAHG